MLPPPSTMCAAAMRCSPANESSPCTLRTPGGQRCHRHYVRHCRENLTREQIDPASFQLQELTQTPPCYAYLFFPVVLDARSKPIILQVGSVFTSRSYSI
jgi:hypothetical protein